MASITKTKEIHAVTENKVGMLKEVSSAIAKAGANITAIAAYSMEDKANFMIVTDNNQKAMEALKGKGFQVKEKEVVKVDLENKVGSLETLSNKIASSGINLDYIYGSVGEGAKSASLIISSDNNDKIQA